MGGGDDSVVKRWKPPGYVRLIGIALLVFGLLNVVGFLLLPPDQWGSARDIAFNIAGITLVLSAGVGILMSRRWGWLLALVAALTVLTTGLTALLAPPDIAFPGADPIALVILVLPSIAMLVGLLSPPTLRWVRGRQTPPPLPPVPRVPDRPIGS
jgi:hypothetical protein